MLTATTPKKKTKHKLQSKILEASHLHQPTPFPFLLHKSTIIQLNDKKIETHKWFLTLRD
jgi:uncharacterized protein YueI